MAKFSRGNPLALMVLCTLWEQPTHPYQVVHVLKQRRKDRAARLNYGSLYTVIASLEKAGLIEATAVTREGGLPARTTYRVTDAGVEEMTSWLADLLAQPREEFPVYMAALSLLPGLPPDHVVALLDQRVARLTAAVETLDRELAASKLVIPELMSVEHRYLAALTRAELAFTKELVDDIRTGRLSGVTLWQAFHDGFVDGRPDPSIIARALANANLEATTQ